MKKLLLLAAVVFTISASLPAITLAGKPVGTLDSCAAVFGTEDAGACGNGGHGAVVYKMFTFGSYYPYIRLDCFYQDGWVYTTISLDPQCA